MTKTELDRDLTRRCLEERWIPRAEGKAGGPCALCEKYHGGGCVGCPISLKTGYMGCRDTPYQQWSDDQTPENAVIMQDWLWVLHGELTENMLAERDEKLSRGKCAICGEETVTRTLTREGTGPWVCGACYAKCYTSGHYLVPVVRGGPWEFGGGAWEVWQAGAWRHHSSSPYRVHNGMLQYAAQGSWHPSAVQAGPDVELRAPKDYDGPLPEGCRWAEGSGPKPYKVLEGSMDGELWFEIERGDDVDDMSRADTNLLHSTRLRGVGADGKTIWEHTMRHKPSFVRLSVDKPRPKADPLLRVHDRVLVTRDYGEYTGEYGMVTELLHEKSGVRYHVCIDSGGEHNYTESDLELICRGDHAREARSLAGDVAGIVARLCEHCAEAFQDDPAHRAFQNASRAAQAIWERASGDDGDKG